MRSFLATIEKSVTEGYSIEILDADYSPSKITDGLNACLHSNSEDAWDLPEGIQDGALINHNGKSVAKILKIEDIESQYVSEFDVEAEEEYEDE